MNLLECSIFVGVPSAAVVAKNATVDLYSLHGKAIVKAS
jgi:hypothetical protein